MFDVLENDTLELLYDVPLVAVEKHPHPADKAKTVSSARQKAEIAGQSRRFLVNEKHEFASTSSGMTGIHNMCERIKKAASYWLLKGKRNSRSRKVGGNDETDAEIARGSVPVGSSQNADLNRVVGILTPDTYSHNIKSEPISEIHVEKSCSWNWKERSDYHAIESTTELPPMMRSLPHRLSRSSVNPKYDASEFSLRHHLVSSGLHYVPVEMIASNGPQYVPCISLMSKLNGQPIIGHPLIVEKLNDGFCDDLLKMAECYSSPSALQTTDLSSGWRSSGKQPKKNGSIHAKSKPRKSTKPRRNALSSKKTRKLSSLRGMHRSPEDQPTVENLKGTSIACIPVNAVFSRINAAINTSIRLTPLPATDNVVTNEVSFQFQ